MDDDIPKPIFPVSDLDDEERRVRSPPKRTSRHDRKKSCDVSLNVTSETLSSQPKPEPALFMSPLRSFCESNGLSDLAVRDMLPNASTINLPPNISTIPSSIPNTQIISSNNNTQNGLYEPVGTSFPTPINVPTPTEMDIESIPNGKAIPGAKPLIKKKKRRVSKKDSTTTTTEKTAKGLRDFSYLVMSKVEQKGTTTYNEVSEELVNEIRSSNGGKGTSNIKRRVYDALNVLRAINIISKHKKNISWVGLPQHSAQALEHLKTQKEEILERMRQKRENYQEMSKSFSSYQMIATRNKHYALVPEDKKIPIPFILATTPSGSQIDCEMAENRCEYSISFQSPFKLYTEVQLLEMMNMLPTPDYPAQTPSHISPSSISAPTSRLEQPPASPK